MLLFCNEFSPSIQGFTKKLMLLAFSYIDSADLEREGPKLTMNFLDAIATLSITNASSVENWA